MFENEKQMVKDEAADALFEIAFEAAFEVVGEMLISVFEGF